MGRFSIRSAVASFACLSFFNGTVHAADSRDELEALSKEERGWSHGERLADGYRGAIAFLQTGRGGLRLETVPSQFIAKATLSRTTSSEAGDGEKFKKFCSMNKYIMRFQKKSLNRYSVELRVDPFESLRLENPVRVLSRSVRFVVSPSSHTSNEKTETRFIAAMAAQLIAYMNAYPSDQKRAVAPGGLVTLDLTGWDEVACDLLEGNAELAIEARVTFESARIVREPIVSPRQFLSIKNELEKVWKPQDSYSKNLIMGGASLLISTQNMLAKNTFDLDRFLSLYTQAFDWTNGRPRTFNGTAEIEAAAEAIDELRRGSDFATTVLRQEISLPSN